MAAATGTRAPAIVLVEPQLGENIGAAARAMANFGLEDLRLVAPRDGWPNEAARAAASRADAVIDAARVYGRLEEAVGDLAYVLATTARTRDVPKAVRGPREAARALRQRAAAGQPTGILFGRERTGLTNEEIGLADEIVTFPVNPAFASLNIAQAVLLVSYEWFQQVRQTGGDNQSPAKPSLPGDPTVPATKAELAGLVEHLVRELDAANFFRTDQRRASLIRAITVMIERRQWTASEVHLMRGIIKDLVGGRRARQKQTDTQP